MLLDDRGAIYNDGRDRNCVGRTRNGIGTLQMLVSCGTRLQGKKCAPSLASQYAGRRTLSPSTIPARRPVCWPEVSSGGVWSGSYP